MHPYMAQQIACQRYEELRRSAQRCRSPLSRRRVRRSVRHHVGWALVEIGLAVARGSGDV
jgi:hypothetical protein